MAKAISLKDYYSTEEAFHHSDRMIRIAAIHHAGSRLANNEKLESILEKTLQDSDNLVACYVAVTLAQAGKKSGIDYLIQTIVAAQEQEREYLDSCLRNCTEFPFAILLNKLAFIESIPNVRDKGMREFLQSLLYFTSDRFYELSKDDSQFRTDFVQQLSILNKIGGLQCRPGEICGRGWIVSIPMGKQPGFLYCPDGRLFLKFDGNVLLNRQYLQKGREILFIANQGNKSPDAEFIYILEDIAPEQQSIPSESLLKPNSEFGLIPGVVINKAPGQVQVLCSNGKSFHEVYRAQKASLNQFALVEETTSLGKPQCHFVSAVCLEPKIVKTLIAKYSQRNKTCFAKITEVTNHKHPKTGMVECEVKTENQHVVTTYIPSPKAGATVLMAICAVCSGEGTVSCDNCNGVGSNLCSGSRKCFRCDGSGTLNDGKECILCEGDGSLEGCKGQRQIDCPACDGNGTIECGQCNGTGEYKPRRTCPKCGGSGNFTVECRKCRGSGNFTIECRKCGGSGRFGGGSCYSCDGSGEKTLECKICDGTGEKTLECKACDGQGHWDAQSCNACNGSGSVECFYCHGDQQIQCPICHGSGNLNCRKCNATGKVTCPYCQGNKRIFHAKLDCIQGRNADDE